MSRRLHAAAIALVLNAASAAAEDARTQSPCSPIIQNARGNVSVTFSGGCTTGITPEQLREIIDSIQVGRAIPVELLDRYERLSQRFGVTDTAVKNFFQLLGEQNVASEDLDSRLRQVAARHLTLQQRAQQLSDDDPAAAPTKRQAKLDIEAGAYDRAEALLAADRDQRRAIELIARGQSKQALTVLQETEQRLKGVPMESSIDVRMVYGYLYKTLAQAFSLTGEKIRADQYLESALKAFEPIRDDPNLKGKNPFELASTMNGIGNIRHERGQYREALADYQLATTLVPNYAYAWHDMFVAYLALANQGDVDLKAMRQALKKTRETGLGLPALDAKYIASLEKTLADFERSSNLDRVKKKR